MCLRPSWAPCSTIIGVRGPLPVRSLRPHLRPAPRRRTACPVVSIGVRPSPGLHVRRRCGHRLTIRNAYQRVDRRSLSLRCGHRPADPMRGSMDRSDSVVARLIRLLGRPSGPADRRRSAAATAANPAWEIRGGHGDFGPGADQAAVVMVVCQTALPRTGCLGFGGVLPSVLRARERVRSPEAREATLTNSVLSSLSRPELEDLVVDLSKRWLAHDGLWFQAVEADQDMPTGDPLRHRRVVEVHRAGSQTDPGVLRSGPPAVGWRRWSGRCRCGCTGLSTLRK